MNAILRSDLQLPADMRDKVPRPVVIWVTEFDEDATGKFAADVSAAHETGQSIIPVVIDSYGGDPYALLGMIAVMDASRLPIATIVEGKAMSCGAMLFALGANGHRYIAPTATLMFHDVSSFSLSEQKTADVKVDAVETERLQDQLFDRVAEQCGRPRKFFHKLLDENKHADLYMTAREARRYNVATTIGLPTFRTDITITHTFGIDGPKKAAVQYSRR